MRHSTPRFVMFLAIGALAVAACGGGDDDPIDVATSEAEAPAAEVAEEASDAAETGSDESSSSEVGFGEFISGAITLAGDENATYSVDDPTLDFVGGGGCGADTFGVTIQVRRADTGVTTMQLSAEVDGDLSGGGTGTFPVQKMSLVTVTEGDPVESRSYDGPATMVVTEHDTGGATSDLDARRMAISLEGALAGSPSDGGGDVELSADLLWVMGCP